MDHTTDHTWQTKVCFVFINPTQLFQSTQYFQSTAYYMRYLYWSFISFLKKKKKQPKLKQSVPIFKRIDPFKQFLVMRLRELDSSHRVFSCSLPANPSWQTFISDTDADDSVHCRWTDEPYHFVNENGNFRLRTMKGLGLDNPFYMSTGFLWVRYALGRTSAARRGKEQKRKR